MAVPDSKDILACFKGRKQSKGLFQSSDTVDCK